MKKIKVDSDFMNKMKELAEKTELEHDGGDDDRLFFRDNNISIFARDMGSKLYKKMEKELKTYQKVGLGYIVYAWNDCSGYSYWANECDEHSANYIQITAGISDPDKVNPQELKDAMEEAFNHFFTYDNTSDHDFSREKKVKRKPNNAEKFIRGIK